MLLCCFLPFAGPGFGWSCCDVDGGGGVDGVGGRWCLAVCQGVINALHSARVSRGTLVAS